MVFRSNVDRGEQFALWAMEGPGANASEQYDWLRARLPVPIDYVVVVADGSSPRDGREKLIARIEAGMRAGARGVRDGFVVGYERLGGGVR